MPPSSESRMPSVIICRTRRNRLAPMAKRMASSLRRLAPRASSMLARFMHAMVMISAISTVKKPISTDFNFGGSGTMVPAASKVTRLLLSARTSTEEFCSSRRRVIASRAASADSRVTPGASRHHGEKVFGIALMKHIIGELRRQGCRGGDGHEQLRRIIGKRAIEILRGDSHNGRGLPVQTKRLPHRVGRGVEAIAPETIADDHDGRVAGLVELGAERSSPLRLDAEHGKK